LARKKTALEAALQRADNGEQARRLGLTFGLALALAAGLAFLLQGIQVWREEAAGTALQDMRKSLAEDLGRVVAGEQSALRQALSDPDLARALSAPDGSGATAAEVRLRQLLPRLVHVEFFPPDLPQLIEADLQKFGYGRANMLAEARDAGGTARAQLLPQDDGSTLLALAQAVVDGNRVAGFAYVMVPGAALVDPVRAVDLAGGQVSLRQGILGSIVALSVGRGGGTEQPALPVPQSILSVGLLREEFFKLGDVIPLLDFRNAVALCAAGGLMLLLAALLGIVRSHRKGQPLTPVAQAAVGMLGKLRGADKAADEPVMPAMEPTRAAVERARAVAAGEVPRPAGPAAVDRSIFRAYDIRGVVGKTLTGDTARMIGKAIGSTVRERGLSEIVVARDGRLSGPELSAELIKGLRSVGCDVIDIGAVPTPALYFATYHLNAGSGVMVTGSHNPPDYNGFKIMVGGETLAEDAIQALYSRIAEGRFSAGSGGLQVLDVADDYVERITGDVQAERRLKVVVDAGNGIAGTLGPRVLEGIGVEVVPLHCEVDGTFPSHHPDPSDPENLQDLIMMVKRLGADLGVAFDGDGDRLGVVTRAGEIIYPDRLLMLFAIDVLNRNPGATVIYDVKCTGHLQDIIVRHGGSPVMWKTGHSLIKAKMREDDAELAGEMSGHFFFRERWFGFDDGIYAAARLMEILGASDREPDAVFAELPKGVSTPELKIATEEGAHYAFIARFREAATFPGARVSTIDGVRADYPDGWGLVRCSNTTPSLVLRFDADSAEALARIQDVFRKQLLAQDAGLKLPF
jgi:phosphomannomutase/phosphoglucomutase